MLCDISVFLTTFSFLRVTDWHLWLIYHQISPWLKNKMVAVTSLEIGRKTLFGVSFPIPMSVILGLIFGFSDSKTCTATKPASGLQSGV